MAKTVREAVRRDESTGEFWMWRITESDIEGEGGQERTEQVNRGLLNKALGNLEDMIAATRAQLADLLQRRAHLEDTRDQVIKMESATADAAMLAASAEAAA